ncbi:aldehyde dehydrogenase family protein [Spirillospora sp. CA-128828]|uniref:aldehyde dehydrogenase family protein n=1 Tax=Spirillospora sp. CA-128828 TaxID=3240033 RepID=UPI003D949158
MQTLSSLLAGKPAGPGARTYASVNPADLDDVVATVELAGPETFAEACRQAREASRRWAATPAPVRGQVIANIGRLVGTNKGALAALLTREIGKPAGEALGEIQEIIDTCDFFLGEGRRLYGQTVPSEMPDKELYTYRKPLGVAAVITAANFPAAVPSWYIVPALLCGNTVVWKPAEPAAAVADALAQIFAHAGVPAGVVQLVHADGPATFEGLSQALEQGLVDKVGFTGSTEVGRRISALCGEHLQSPCLELGGKNPMVVEPDADLDLAVRGAVFSGFATAGQRCTSLGTVWVHDSLHDEFLGRFADAVSALPIGEPNAEVFYGPLIEPRYLPRFESYLGLVEQHHKLHGSTGTGRITADNPRAGFTGDPAAGLYCHPAVVSGIRPGDALYGTETFGPLVGLGRYASLDEAIELANGHGYGLSAAIYTRGVAAAHRFRRGCRAGMISVNNSTVGAEAHLPFGGNGLSGNGSRQSGQWVIDQFTSWQSVNWDYSGVLQRAQMDVAEVTVDLGFTLSGDGRPTPAGNGR